MTLLNFEDDEIVVAKPERTYLADMRRQTHLVSSPSSDWRPLRDYIMARIEDLHGPQVRDGAKESGIVKSFIRRWEDLAEPIARFLLEDRQGYWEGRQVLLISFCRGADPFVARPVAERLRP